jgi:hypothetical protein
MYSDDAGNSSVSDGKYYVISGVIVHESSYDFVVDKIEDYKELNFIGRYKNAEIHVHDIWQGKNEFEKIDFNTKVGLLANLYCIIKELPIIMLAVGINKDLIMSQFPNWTVFNASWTFLTERFDKYISDNGDALNKGMMFIDKNSKMPDREITKIVNRLRIFGSNYQSIDYIHGDPSFVNSKDSPLLQIADAISYCTLKHLCQHKWFKTYWFSIKDRFRTDHLGNILGYGLKIFPKKGDEAI